MQYRLCDVSFESFEVTTITAEQQRAILPRRGASCGVATSRWRTRTGLPGGPKD